MEAENLFPGVRVVLIETSHPGNIGAAARAMKNMGLTELVLVNPQDFPHQKAIFRSASAADVVKGARVVESIEEAIADCELIIGTSARDRRIPWPMMLDLWGLLDHLNSRRLVAPIPRSLAFPARAEVLVIFRCRRSATPTTASGGGAFIVRTCFSRRV